MARSKAHRVAEKAVVTTIGGDGMIEHTEIDACGHVDMHYTGAEILFCELPKGHNGDHQCQYPGGTAFWNDGAGKRV